jgi:hypothetical protein
MLGEELHAAVFDNYGPRRAGRMKMDLFQGWRCWFGFKGGSHEE